MVSLVDTVLDESLRLTTNLLLSKECLGELQSKELQAVQRSIEQSFSAIKSNILRALQSKDLQLNRKTLNKKLAYKSTKPKKYNTMRGKPSSGVIAVSNSKIGTQRFLKKRMSDLDFQTLYIQVKKSGGPVEVTRKKMWLRIARTIRSRTELEKGTSASYDLKRIYMKYLEKMKAEFDTENNNDDHDDCYKEDGAIEKQGIDALILMSNSN